MTSWAGFILAVAGIVHAAPTFTPAAQEVSNLGVEFGGLVGGRVGRGSQPAESVRVWSSLRTLLACTTNFAERETLSEYHSPLRVVLSGTAEQAFKVVGSILRNQRHAISELFHLVEGALLRTFDEKFSAVGVGCVHVRL